MKEFRCASRRNDCNAVLSAQTEERLVELASLHLREVHGMTTLTQENVAEIKQLFSGGATADAARVVDRIFEKYNCNAEPECSWRYIAEAEMILTGDSTAHTQELKAA
jgi:predicted small metal-binding protein